MDFSNVLTNDLFNNIKDQSSKSKIIEFNIKDKYPDVDINKYYIYAHIYKDSNIPFYIGKGNLYRCTSLASRTSDWMNIFNSKDIDVILLEYNIDNEDDALIKEIEYIAKYKRISDGGSLINVTEGGESITTEFGRNNLSRNSKGFNNYFYGKHFVGESNPNFGNKGKLNPNSKPVLKFDINGNLIERYSNLREAGDKNGDSGAIGLCCNHRRHAYKNYIYRCKYSTHKFIYTFYNRRFRNTVYYHIHRHKYKTYYDKQCHAGDNRQAKICKPHYGFFVYRINRIVGAVNLICHITLNKFRQIQRFGNINTSALRNIDIFRNLCAYVICQSRTCKKVYRRRFKCKNKHYCYNQCDYFPNRFYKSFFITDNKRYDKHCQ